MGLMYVLVEMGPSGSSWTVRSRKFIDLSGGSTSQVRSPNCMRFAMWAGSVALVVPWGRLEESSISALSSTSRP